MSVVLWLKSLHIAIDSLNDSDISFGLTQKRVSLVAFKSYYHCWKTGYLPQSSEEYFTIIALSHDKIKSHRIH